MTSHLDDFDLVWLQTGFIGDLVLTTAAMELAKAQWPDKKQHAITTRVGVEVLKGAEPLATRIAFAKSDQSALVSMRRVRDELRVALGGRKAVLLQAHRSTRSSLLSAYLGWPTVAYREGALLARWRVPRVAVLHEAHRIALLLEPLGVARSEIVKAKPRLLPLPLSEDGPLARLHGERVVAIAPGSVWGTKRWTPEGFAALARALIGHGCLVAFVGSASEVELAAGIEAKVGAQDRLLNLVGKTSLDDMRRILPACKLLVANDSSPVHYASALGVPTIELFGATVPGMGFGPLAERSASLGIELACRPCSDHGPQVCPLGHFRCMRELRVETVLEACLRALAPDLNGAGKVLDPEPPMEI